MDRPRFHRSAMVATLAWLTLASSCASPRRAPTPAPLRVAPNQPNPSDVLARLFEAHNAERARRRLAPLSANPALTEAAAEHARDMADRRRMSHKGGDESSPFDRIGRAGYAFRSAGENVAYGFDDVDSVMLGWMRSPGHRRNILGDYAEVGLGRAIDRDGMSYWCATFGTPVRP